VEVATSLILRGFEKGPMLAEILAYLDSKSGPKLALLSAHDTSVMPLLICLGIFDNKWPRFAADLAFELYEVGYGLGGLVWVFFLRFSLFA
jgi:hypothetical protein